MHLESIYEQLKTMQFEAPIAPIKIADKEKIKLAIAACSSGQCKFAFAESLMNLRLELLKMDLWADLETTYFGAEGSVIHGNREHLIQKSLDWGATHILFIDDDMKFHPTAVHIMFSRRHPIVICNYAKKQLPITPMAVKIDKSGPITAGGGIEEAWFGGFGLALIEAKVFQAVPAPRFLPRWDDNNKIYTTEDVPFFERAKEAGFPCWVDRDASQLVEHIGAYSYTLNRLY